MFACAHDPSANKSATISECERYRYALDRRVGPGPALAWLMLNPSTASAFDDDPTIRKVKGFTARAGYGVAMVVNLFAWRATDPKDCRANLSIAEGPENKGAIFQAVQMSDAVVCAWGAQPWARPQAVRVLRWLDGWLEGRPEKLLCIGTTADGSPKHPLRPSYSNALRPFDAGAFLSRYGR